VPGVKLPIHIENTSTTNHTLSLWLTFIQTSHTHYAHITLALFLYYSRIIIVLFVVYFLRIIIVVLQCNAFLQKSRLTPINSRAYDVVISDTLCDIHRIYMKKTTNDVVYMYYAVRCCIGINRLFVFTHQVAALGCVKWRHDRHLDSVTSNRKSDSVNRYEFTWRTMLPNFIPIRSWNDTALGFFEEIAPTTARTRTTRTTACVATWYQFLI